MSNRGLRTVLAAASLVCALACGGSHGSNTEPERTVRLDRKSLELTVEEGVTQQASLVATAAGFAGPLHVRATADGSGLELVESSSHESYALVTVRSAAALAPGTYQGTLTVAACADASCEVQVGSPVRVPYAVTVLRRLLTPNPVTLGAISGSTAEATVQVLLPPRATGFDVAVTAGASWLTVTDRTAGGFRVRAAARPRGTYQGALRFTAGDESRVVQVVYEVTPRPMSVTPNPVVLAAVSGSGASASPSVALPDDAGDFAIEVRTPEGWLSVAGKTADGFTLAARSVPAGSYSGSLTVTAGDSTLVVPVDYEVSAPPGGEHGILAAPASLTFVATEGGAATKPLGVTPPSWNPALDARAEYGPGPQGCLTVTPRPGGFDVTADAGQLPQGGYAAAVSIRGDSATPELRVPVALTVGPGLVRPPDRTATITASSTADELDGSVRIDMASGPPRTWSAASDAAWLVLDPATGLTGEALVYHLDLAHVAAMASGAEDVATVTITAQPATVTPTSFQVRIVKSTSELVRVTPYAQPAGRPGRFLVRGRGFQLLQDLAGRVVIDGVGPVTATRLSDEELEIRVPALPAATYTLRIASALDLPTSAIQLTLFEPGAPSYARIPQLGTKRGLLYDPRRQSIHVVNVDQRMLLRYALSGETWIQTRRSIANLESIAVTPDGGTLIAVTTTGRLLFLDPDTLADRDAVETGLYLEITSMTSALPVTNDGRLWLPGTQRYFDLSTRTLGIPEYERYTHDGHYCMSMSRNGERLLISPYANSNSFLYYADAIDGIVRPITGQSWFYEAAHSDDGDRVVIHAYTVLDGNHAPVGTMNVPDPFHQTQAALSPDGDRAYVLASHDAWGRPPKIFVYDTSSAPPTGPALPLLGSIDLPEFPTCHDSRTSECRPHSVVLVSPDERAFIIAGDEALMIVPIPAVLDPPSAP